MFLHIQNRQAHMQKEHILNMPKDSQYICNELQLSMVCRVINNLNLKVWRQIKEVLPKSSNSGFSVSCLTTLSTEPFSLARELGIMIKCKLYNQGEIVRIWFPFIGYS